MTAHRTTALQTDRSDIVRTRWHESAHVPLDAGQVRLRVEHFGLSANNVTYATLGDALHYWDFFPQQDPAWGCVPVWGFATVSESRCDEVAEGRRVFGFLPFATDLVMTPNRVRSGGFVDASAHRAALPAPYNAYTDASEGTSRTEEAYDAVLRPLFTTSFLIAEWLSREQHFGADTVVISSASSKTAYGTAYAIGRACAAQRPELVGLTSPAHVASTEALGLYDRVLAYDEVAALDAERATVYVDLSGSSEIRAAVHARCAGLRHDCAVGLTHWQASEGAQPLPGPDPVFFFAPSELERQSAQSGAAEVFGRISAAMSGFVDVVNDPEAPLMSISWHEGIDAAAAAYLDVVTGRTDPAEAAMLTLRDR